MRIFIRLCVVMCSTLLVDTSRVAADEMLFTWTGAGDGETWEDSNNWDPIGVPNGPEDVANFDMVGVPPIKANGSLGQNITIGSLQIKNSNGLDIDFASTNTGMVIAQLESRIGLRIDNSTVNINALLNLQTTVGNSFIIDLSSTQQFGFNNVSVNGPITTNDNDLVVTAGGTNTALFRIDQDFADGNNGDLIINGAVSVGVDNNLTANNVRIVDGSLTLINDDSKLNANTVTVVDGSLNVKGTETPTNPLPNLTSPIGSRGGHITVTDGSVAIQQGVNLGRGNTIFDVSPTDAEQLEWLVGVLNRQIPGATVSVLANPSASLKFDSVIGADANGVLPYATFNNTDFAQFIPATGEIVQLTSYVPLQNANPGDAVEAVGGRTLSSPLDASVVKVNNATIAGFGHTITADAILVKGVSATISNATVKPHDQPGTDLNELIIHAPVGGDRLTLTGVDVADNNDPTVLTFNGPQGGRVTVNDALSYTGGTNITGGTVILNGPDAQLGTGDVFVGVGSLLRLIKNTFQNNLVVGAGPFPATIQADGQSSIDGMKTVLSDGTVATTRIDPITQRPYVVFNVPQEDDKLTIAGNSGPDDSNAGAFNVKIQGGGTVELAEGTTHTVPGTMSVEGATLRLRQNAQIIYDRSVYGPFPDGNAIEYSALTLSGFGLGGGTVAGNGSLLPTELPVGTSIALSILFGFAEPGDSIGTLTFGGGVAFLGTEGPATYRAEVTDDGQADKLDIDGLLDLSGTNDFLELDFFSGSTLNGTYTLATYTQLAGVFDHVTFDGTPVADPTAPGAFGGTHQLLYGPTALLLTSAAPIIAGDYNNDGNVDAADYVVWRKNEGTINMLPNDAIGSTIGQAHYDQWRANFGTTASSGAAIISTAAVPEPASVLLLVLAAAFRDSRWRAGATAGLPQQCPLR